MRATFSKLAFAAALAGLFAANATAAETLKFGGTGAATGMLRQLAAPFTASLEGKVDIIPNLGSGGAIHALADGKLDLAVSARPLTQAETASGLKQVMVLRTAFVLATSLHNPNGLKAAELPEIYSAAKPLWADDTPIRIILRPRSESDTGLLGGMFTGMEKAVEGARARGEVPVAATDQDNVDLAERTPGALIGSTLTQLKTENRQLAVVPLDGVTPTLTTFESGAYPFTKKLFFVMGPNSNPDAQRFIDFVKSPLGVKLLRAANALPGAD